MDKKYKEFGLIWSVILIIFFSISIYKGNIHYSLLVASLLFIICSLYFPRILSRFYHLWIKLGNTIGSIISRVIMFILYFGLFTPISLILRILGKDLLYKRVNKKSLTYWMNREVQPASMKNQF